MNLQERNKEEASKNQKLKRDFLGRFSRAIFMERKYLEINPRSFAVKKEEINKGGRENPRVLDGKDIP